MTTKTITVTEDAYDVLYHMKMKGESFSDTLLRIASKRSLREFVGVLSLESAEKMRKTITEMRKRHSEMHHKRVKRIIAALEG